MAAWMQPAPLQRGSSLPENQRHGPDLPGLEYLAMLVAFALMTLPLVLHSSPAAAAINAWTLGALVASVNLASLPRVRRSSDLFNVVLGMWLMLSPVALDFLDDMHATVFTIVAGLFVSAIGFRQTARAFPHDD